jgi:hypothetical protein
MIRGFGKRFEALARLEGGSAWSSGEDGGNYSWVDT